MNCHDSLSASGGSVSTASVLGFPKTQDGATMAEESKVTLEELVVSNLAMSDALAKLMIAKGLITDEEFKAQLSAERANYLAVLQPCAAAASLRGNGSARSFNARQFTRE